MDVLVGIRVSVGRGVNVSDGIVDAFSVGMEVKVSVTERLIDVSAGMGEAEAGACPALLKLQASVVRIKMIGRNKILFFMA